jgi:Delta7-sterol 5-desaturase
MDTFAIKTFGLFFSAMAFFFAIATLAHLVYFVWYRKRFHPDDQRPRRIMWSEMRWSTLSLLGNAVLATPFQLAVAGHTTKAYDDVHQYGWGYLIVSVVLMLTFTETCVYWVHRAVHTNALWFLHKPHHEFKVTSPFAGAAFNPIDSFLQSLPHHLCLFLIPLHTVVYNGFLAFLLVWTVAIHTRVYFVRFWAINSASHHTLHHWYGTSNFGQFFTFWDRLCGTYRAPESAYGEIPAWVHKPGTVIPALDGSPEPSIRTGQAGLEAAQPLPPC